MKCCVKDCVNTNSHSSIYAHPAITFFSFPKQDDVRYASWVAACVGSQGILSSKVKKVCAIHFESDFYKQPNASDMFMMKHGVPWIASLTDQAIPTLNVYGSVQTSDSSYETTTQHCHFVPEESIRTSDSNAENERGPIINELPMHAETITSKSDFLFMQNSTYNIHESFTLSEKIPERNIPSLHDSMCVRETISTVPENMGLNDNIPQLWDVNCSSSVLENICSKSDAFQMCNSRLEIAVPNFLNIPNTYITDNKRGDKHFESGDLLWCFINGWWPCIKVLGSEVGKEEKIDTLWVYWMSDRAVSQVRFKNVVAFSEKLQMLRIMSSTKESNKQIKSLLSIVEALRRHLGFSILSELSNFSWIRCFPLPLLESGKKIILKPYPQEMIDRLFEIKIELRKQSGVIIDHAHIYKRKCNFGYHFVIWYEDFQCSEVHHSDMSRFINAIEVSVQTYSDNDPIYSNELLESSKDFLALFGITNIDVWEEIYECLTNRKEEFAEERLCNVKLEKLYPRKFRELLNIHLDIKIAHNLTFEKRKMDFQNCLSYLKSTGHSAVESLQKICLVCIDHLDAPAMNHIVVCGSICDNCISDYISKMYSLSESGKCVFCAICGGDTNLFECYSMECSRAYCSTCMKYILYPTKYLEMMLEHPFICFSCTSIHHTDSLVRPQENVNENLRNFFMRPAQNESNFQVEDKFPLRVFAPFDGISGCMVALKSLNLIPQTYYASEINDDAINISFEHHSEIVQLGDLSKIKEEDIKNIIQTDGPINLYIGGSPCQDFSSANPHRQGMEGDGGKLVHLYMRILGFIKKHNPSNVPFFYVLENVASMQTSDRLAINKLFGHSPRLLHAGDFSAQNRTRLVWDNLPVKSLAKKKVVLQDCLESHRIALVEKISTITCSPNSLRQGKYNMKPILMKGQLCDIRLNEVEAVIGFPEHYTDYGLSTTKRLKLLGNSFSIPSFCALLHCLKIIFKSKDSR